MNRLSDDTGQSPKQAEWRLYEKSFDWPNRTIGELFKRHWRVPANEIVKGRTQIGDFQVGDREPRKCQEALSIRGLVLMPWPLQQAKSYLLRFRLTAEKWRFSLGSKLMGQINLVQEAIPFIKEKGPFTLVSGVLNDEPIFAGVLRRQPSRARGRFCSRCRN